MPLAAVELSTLPQQLANGILLGSIYALIALGYTMVYGVLKLINFAHGEVFMLGAYAALFASWGLGFTPNNTLTATSPVNLLIMLLASMALCAVVGVIIERFAYRPIRNQPRISSLITAIGVSLLLQYGGQLFLPTSPAPNIDGKVNPYRNAVELKFREAPLALREEAKGLESQVQKAQAEWDARLAAGESRFAPSSEGRIVRDALNAAKTELNQKQTEIARQSAVVVLPVGQLIMLGATVVLMGLLTYLVMFTRPGRAMRAVSHDFDSAALMGVNVNSIVTFTFLIGSALAGAGAMMNATFLSGTKIDTFFGMLPGVKAFVAAVLGGIGNIPGAVLGGVLMGVAEALVVWVGIGQYRDAVAFVVLIAVLLLRPGGLLGSSKVEKV